MSEIKRIPVSALEVGMYIADVSNSWVPDNNLSRKGMVKNPKVIEQIIKLGVTDVYIDVSRGKEASVGEDREQINARQNQALKELLAKPFERPEAKVAFDEELEAAKAIQSEATKMVERVLQDVKMGKPIDVSPAEQTADGILDSLDRNQNALLCLTQLRTKDRYLLEHSFNVSVLMGVLASSLGYQGKELKDLVSGALLHDIGKIKVSDEVLHKPGSLEPHEWEEMKRHVTYGEEVLNQIPGLPQVVRDICAQHHERLDGSGYPRGLSAEQLPMHSRMSSVADVYDAVTADRVYHKGMAPTEALRRMLEWSDEQHLDKDVVYQFIRALSIYPAGEFVELSNARIAVVETVDATRMDKPKVRVVYNLTKKIVVPPFPLDLAEKGSDIQIVRPTDPVRLGLNPLELLQGALAAPAKK